MLFIDMFGPSVNFMGRKFDIKEPWFVGADRSCLHTNDGVEFLLNVSDL